MHRKGLVRIAACAALACAGLVGASQHAQADEVKLVGSDLTLSNAQPKYLDEPAAAPAAPAAPAPRMPLMALLDQAGVAKTLDDAKINIGGLVEGSWTYSASSPP